MNGSLVTMLVVVLALAAVAYARGGDELVRAGLGRGAGLLLEFALLLVISFMAAGLATVLVPQAWIESALGSESGVRGILLGAGVGMVTPSGPFVAMPIAAAMLKSGAAVAPVVAFVTAWSLLAVHRLVAWEIPIVGFGVALLRYSICLAVPVLVGLAARALVDR